MFSNKGKITTTTEQQSKRIKGMAGNRKPGPLTPQSDLSSHLTDSTQWVKISTNLNEKLAKHYKVWKKQTLKYWLFN